MATNLTLKEEKFHNLVRSLDQHDIVDSLALPGIVQFAENFEFREEKVIPYLEEQLASFDLRQYGTIVLGCTHFPYFENSLRAIFPGNTNIISGSIGTAKNLKRTLEEKNLINIEGTGDITFFQSDIKIEAQETLAKYKKLLGILDKVIS